MCCVSCMYNVLPTELLIETSISKCHLVDQVPPCALNIMRRHIPQIALIRTLGSCKYCIELTTTLPQVAPNMLHAPGRAGEARPCPAPPPAAPPSPAGPMAHFRN